MLLTAKKLKQLVNYDKNTGFFTDKKDKKIGSLSEEYVLITIENKVYRASRLAWLYVYGKFPKLNLDHKDRIKHHNWISNLREFTQIENLRNTGNYKSNTSGVKGVTKKGKKWKADIMVNQKHYYLGVHTFDEAVCHRLAAEQCLDWPNSNTNSPAFLHVQKIIN